MRRTLPLVALLVLLTISTRVQTVAAQGCEGTSGSASINDAPWTTNCVFAATSAACVDTLGEPYECFQIIGSDSTSSYAAIAIFLSEAPTQGQTYPLGGGGAHGAMVLGDTGLWITGSAPYTGQVQVTLFDPGQATIECNFSFTAQSLFFGGDLTVTNGTFVGRLVGVTPRTWSDVKSLYRDGP